MHASYKPVMRACACHTRTRRARHVEAMARLTGAGLPTGLGMYGCDHSASTRRSI